jgi:hypothetical protein
VDKDEYEVRFQNGCTWVGITFDMITDTSGEILDAATLERCMRIFDKSARREFDVLKYGFFQFAEKKKYWFAADAFKQVFKKEFSRTLASKGTNAFSSDQLKFFLLETLRECIHGFADLEKLDHFKAKRWYHQYLHSSKIDLMNLLKAQNEVLKSEGKPDLDALVVSYRLELFGAT